MSFLRAPTLLLVFVAVAARAAAPVDVREVRVWAGPDSTRVVLDVSANIEHTLFTLHDPERVVVDIPDARVTVPIIEALAARQL